MKADKPSKSSRKLTKASTTVESSEQGTVNAGPAVDAAGANPLADELFAEYTRVNIGPVGWLREYDPHELLDLQRKAHAIIRNGGALTQRAVTNLNAVLLAVRTYKNAVRRKENERRARSIESVRSFVLRSQGLVATDGDPKVAFEQELTQIHGVVDGPVKRRAVHDTQRLVALLHENQEVAEASPKELLRIVDGTDLDAPNPTSCRCFVLADFLADRIRRCEQVWTPEQWMMYLIAWLIARDPTFDPITLGFQGFRAWGCEPSDGNRYDRRESIREWIGLSQCAVYLGSRFQERGTRYRDLQLQDLLDPVAGLALDAVGDVAIDPTPLTRREKAILSGTPRDLIREARTVVNRIRDHALAEVAGQLRETQTPSSLRAKEPHNVEGYLRHLVRWGPLVKFLEAHGVKGLDHRVQRCRGVLPESVIKVRRQPPWFRFGEAWEAARRACGNPEKMDELAPTPELIRQLVPPEKEAELPNPSGS